MGLPSHDAASGRDAVAAVSALADPTRRLLYDRVVAADEPVTRDHVSAASGFERSVVGYHLDKLVDAGLLTATYARPAGRTGPGAGRPAKWYERADDEISVTLPPRAYQLVAEVLARTLEATDASAELRGHLERVAAELGRELAPSPTDADKSSDILECLSACGFEPAESDGVIRLRNCPFDPLARAHTELVCGMNRALLAGLTDGSPTRLEPTPDNEPSICCVTLRRDPARSA